jgi:hypothetical protein
MTIPEMMNCAHQQTGWCLECVSKMVQSNSNIAVILYEPPHLDPVADIIPII